MEKQKRIERRKARLEAAREFQRPNKEQAAEQREELRQEVGEAEVGHVPKRLPAEVESTDKINVEEPEVPKMKLKKGGYGHGYNAQASVDIGGIGLVVGGHVSNAANDRHQLEACIDTVEANLGKGSIGRALADRGYDNIHQIDKLEARGIDILCELQPNGNEAQKDTEVKRRGRAKRTRERREAHFAKIRTEDNTEKRKRRRETVEPLFGSIKNAMGFRQFMVKGLAGANAEWDLVLLCSNVQKLGRNQKWREYISRN